MFRAGFLLLTLSPLLAFGLEFQAEKPLSDAATVPAAVSPAPDSGETAAPVKREALTSEKRGDIFMARKMYREAIEMYREMPPTAVTMNKIGIAYHQMVDMQAARRYYEKAIKLNPKYSEAVNNLGTVYYANKSYGRAVRQYQKALKLSPDSASVYSNLGTAYFARKKYKEAFEAYQEALKLDPDVFEHRGSYGVLLQERNVEERARFHFYLAKTYAKSGMTDRALLYVRKALEEGFKERNRFLEDPEFTPLKDNPEFKQLMTQEPRVL